MTKLLRRLLLLIFLFFSLCICSCKEQVLFEPDQVHTLVDANTASWHVSMPTEVNSFIEKEECFMGFHFRNENRYAVYKKEDSTTWRKTLLINTDDSIFLKMSYYGRFHMYGLENAFVTNPFFYPKSFMLVNILDKTTKEYEVSILDTSFYLNIMPSNLSTAVLKNRLYLSLATYESHKNLSSKYSKPSLAKVEFQNDSLIESTIFGGYPAIYKEHYYHQPEGGYLTTDGQYLYQSFSNSHLVHIYDDTCLLRTVNLPSKYIDKFVPIDTSGNMASREYVANYLYFTFNYMGLMYDSYRQLFYQILVFPQKTMYTSDFSVMVFDKDLNFLSEQLFDGLKYRSGHFVIAKEGVYIGRKLEIQSPHLYMQLFKPVKIGAVGKLKRFFKGSEVNY